MVAVAAGGGGAGSASTLTVPAPPVEQYAPQAGDVWAVKVWRPQGALVAGPVGWTQAHTVEAVRDPETGVLGDVTFWWRVLADGAGGPVVFTLFRPVMAKAMLRAYRDDAGPVPDSETWAPLLVRRWIAELEA